MSNVTTLAGLLLALVVPAGAMPAGAEAPDAEPSRPGGPPKAEDQLDVTRSNGSVETWHLAVDSFLPVARVATGADSRMPAPERTFFSDYREVAGSCSPTAWKSSSASATR